MAVGTKMAEPELNVNMTPLIDVTFLLIIFFMIVSTFNQMERTAELKLPAAAYQAQVKRDISRQRMIVNIEKGGTVVLYGQRMGYESFRKKLSSYAPALRALGKNGNIAPIVLRGDKNCSYEKVKKVLGAIYEQKFKKIMFAAYEVEKKNSGRDGK